MLAKETILWGLARAWRSPRLILGLWLLNFLAALPAAVLMSSILADSIGASRFHEGLRDGFDTDWSSEFAFETDGLADTFGPEILGHGAILQNLERWWRG